MVKCPNCNHSTDAPATIATPFECENCGQLLKLLNRSIAMKTVRPSATRRATNANGQQIQRVGGKVTALEKKVGQQAEQIARLKKKLEQVNKQVKSNSRMLSKIKVKDATKTLVQIIIGELEDRQEKCLSTADELGGAYKIAYTRFKKVLEDQDTYNKKMEQMYWDLACAALTVATAGAGAWVSFSLQKRAKTPTALAGELTEAAIEKKLKRLNTVEDASQAFASEFLDYLPTHELPFPRAKQPQLPAVTRDPTLYRLSLKKQVKLKFGKPIEDWKTVKRWIHDRKYENFRPAEVEKVQKAATKVYEIIKRDKFQPFTFMPSVMVKALELSMWAAWTQTLKYQVPNINPMADHYKEFVKKGNFNLRTRLDKPGGIVEEHLKKLGVKIGGKPLDFGWRTDKQEIQKLVSWGRRHMQNNKRPKPWITPLKAGMTQAEMARRVLYVCNKAT